MVDIPKLKGKIVEKQMTLDEFAEKSGIGRARLYRRFSGVGKDFTIEEVSTISEILALTGSEINMIFFAKNVS